MTNHLLKVQPIVQEVTNGVLCNTLSEVFLESIPKTIYEGERTQQERKGNACLGEFIEMHASDVMWRQAKLLWRTFVISTLRFYAYK